MVLEQVACDRCSHSCKFEPWLADLRFDNSWLLLKTNSMTYLKAELSSCNNYRMNSPRGCTGIARLRNVVLRWQARQALELQQQLLAGSG